MLSTFQPTQNMYPPNWTSQHLIVFDTMCWQFSYRGTMGCGNPQPIVVRVQLHGPKSTVAMIKAYRRISPFFRWLPTEAKPLFEGVFKMLHHFWRCFFDTGKPFSKCLGFWYFLSMGSLHEYTIRKVWFIPLVISHSDWKWMKMATYSEFSIRNRLWFSIVL